jgi:hypothetical protein
LNSDASSLTNLWNGSFLISNSVDFWYFLISLRATVPGLNLCGFFNPPWVLIMLESFVVLRAALLANIFLGALDPVYFLAVCLVLAIFIKFLKKSSF